MTPEEGGNVVNGLSVSLKAEQDKSSDKIVLTLEIMNVSRGARASAPIQILQYSDSSMIPGDSWPPDATLVLEQVEGERSMLSPFVAGLWLHQVHREVEVSSLKPGGSRTYKKQKRLLPGTYKAHVLYEALANLVTPIDRTPLKSNSLTITVAR